MEIEVLRLSTRNYRDLRITTHIALVTRAFGGKRVYLPSEASTEIERTVKEIVQRFGGAFDVTPYEKPMEVIRKRKKEGWKVVHLTMYGERLGERTKELKKTKKMLIVVGADKVPPEIYQAADYNIGVTGQPHSEVAALAVTMHEMQGGKEESLPFKGAKIKVTPSARGKKIVKGESD